MGLDMYIYRLNKEGDISELLKGEGWWKDVENYEELFYWRKFYELDRWLRGEGERIEILNDDPVWKWYVYRITKPTLEALKTLLEQIIDMGVYVYRDGENPRERIKLNHETYRQQLDDADVNWERDEIEPIYESRMGGLDADCGYSDWYWLHLWNTYDELKEKLPTITDNDVLIYYPSF